MDDSKRAYNTWEENQRIRESARVAKRTGKAGPIPTTVNISNTGRAYNTYYENQRIKESVKVYNDELARDEEKEIKSWMILLELPDVIRKLLLRKLKFLTFIYDIIVVFLFYKFTLYLESVFNFKGNVYDTLFNNSYKPSSAEIQGSIFYLIIFGLPILYTIIQVIRFSIFSLKDIIRLFTISQSKQEIQEDNIAEERIEEKDPELTFNFDGLDKINQSKEIKRVEEQEEFFKTD